MKLLNLMLVWASSAMAIKIFVANCPRTLGTCNNICYAINYGQAPGKVHRNSAVAKSNRIKSGCTKTPCSNTKYKQYGNSCDEYPFATTTEGGTNAILRCVPEEDNHSQGGQLGKFYGRPGMKVVQGEQYQVAVMAFENATFCKHAGMKNDGSEYERSGRKFVNAKRAATSNLAGFPRDGNFEDIVNGEAEAIRPNKSQWVLDSTGRKALVLIGENDDLNPVSLIGADAYSAFLDEWVKIVRLL